MEGASVGSHHVAQPRQLLAGHSLVSQSRLLVSKMPFLTIPQAVLFIAVILTFTLCTPDRF